MRPLLLLLMLLLVPTALAAQGLHISIDAPQTVLPGGTVDVLVSTTIQDVRVLSIPTEVDVLRPDGTRAVLPVTNRGDGTYVAQLYAPLRGDYEITARVRVADQEFSEQAVLRADQPPFQGVLSVNATHIDVVSPVQYVYDVRVVAAVPGVLSEQEPIAACEETCASCSIACPVGDDLVFVRATNSFSYDMIAAANTQEPIIARYGQTIPSTGALIYQDGVLTAAPEELVVTQNTLLVFDDDGVRIQPVLLDDQGVPVDVEVAYDFQSGSWYAFSTTSAQGLVRPGITDRILSAQNAAGEALQHTETTVLADGVFEVRTDRQDTPPRLPVLNESSRGVLVTGEWDVAMRLTTDRQAIFPTTLGVFPARFGSAYYATQDHVLLNARPESIIENVSADEFALITAQDTVRLTRESGRLIVLDASLQEIVSRPLTSPEWTVQLPEGVYYVLIESEDTIAAPIEVIAANQTIRVLGDQSLTGTANTQLVLTRTITNLHTRPVSVDITYDGPYTVLLYDAQGNRLTDTNLNGVPDTGLIAPQATKTVVAHILLPANAASHTIDWEFSSQEARVERVDTITVEQPSAFSDQDDVAITRLAAQGRSVTLSAYNFDTRERSVVAEVLTRTAQGDDTQRHTLVLAPGVSEHTFSVESGALSVRVELLVDDADDSNNFRELRIPARPGLQVAVSEQQGRDHEWYVVRTTAPQGTWAVEYPDERGESQLAQVAVLSEQANTQVLLFRLPLATNTDLIATLIQAESPTFEPHAIIDNRDSRVRTQGLWFDASQVPGFFGAGYMHDLNEQKGQKAVEYFAADTPAFYEVEIWHPGDRSFASNTRFEIGDEVILVNQQNPSAWRYIGRYWLDEQTPIRISNAGSDGFVVADAIRVTRIDQYRTAESHVIEPEEVVADSPHLIFTSRGEAVRANIELREPASGAVRRSGLLPEQARTSSGDFEIHMSFEDGPVDSLVVHRANPAQMRVGLEPVARARAQQFTNRRVADSFAIDPQFDSDYSFTRVAQGRELLKCTDYDFSNQECLGEFEHVMFLTPGRVYTATLDPRDPLFIEVEDEVLIPISAQCSTSGGDSGDWSPTTCDGTYSTTPTCADARIWCDDSIVESHTGSRGDRTGVDALFADPNRDPASQCESIDAVFVDYRATESTNNRRMRISRTDGASWTALPCGVNNNGALQTCDVTSTLAWTCEDFFGANPTARIESSVVRTGGPPSGTATLNLDYMVFRIDYTFAIEPLETDRVSYTQGSEVFISGVDIWDPSTTVNINITDANSNFVTQITATTDGSGEFVESYILPSYAPLGMWTLDAWQPSDPSITASKTFNVTLRTPTISSVREGNFYNRSEVVRFVGSNWVMSETVSVSGVDPEGNPLVFSPTSNVTSASGDLVFDWVVPDDLSILTGPYTFTFVEDLNSSYSAVDDLQVVILPSSAVTHDSVDQLDELYRFDGVYAAFVGRKNAGAGRFMTISYPPTTPVGVTLNQFDFELFHRQPAVSGGATIQWFNPGTSTWQNVCDFPARSTPQWDTCDLLSLVNTNDYFNQVQIRIANINSGAGGPDVDTLFETDIAFLRVNFTYPPPLAALIAPPNNTFFNWTQAPPVLNFTNVTLSWQANETFFPLEECRLYINDILNFTDSSPVNASIASLNQDYDNGEYQWRVECTDNSARALTAITPTRTFWVDTIPPVITINDPILNGNYPFTSLDLSFTVTDNFDNLACEVFVNGALQASLTPDNTSTPTTVPVSGLADGVHEWSVTCTDQANTVSSGVIEFLVDGTNPVVTFVPPTTQDNGAQREDWNYINATVTDANDAVGFVDFDRSVVLWMPFEDFTSGTSVADLSTYGNDGTIIASGVSRTRAGRFGSAMWFTEYDSADRIEIPHSPELSLSTGGTLEAWVYQDPDTSGPWRRVVCKETETENAGAWCMQVENSGDRIRVSMGSSGQENSDSAVPRGEWVHIAWTFDGAEWRWYINGNLDRVQANTQLPITTTQPVLIGNSNGGPRGWEGGIDEVRVHNRALSPEEIRSSVDARLHNVQANVTGIVEGVYLYNVTAIDQGGRISTTETRTLFVDQTPPVSMLNAPINNSWFNTTTVDVNFTLSDNLAPQTNYTLYLDGVPQATGAVANNTDEIVSLSGLADGAYELTLEAFDHVLNFAPNITINFFVDTTPPVITLNNPLNNTNWSTSTLTFNFTVSDALSPNATCDLIIDSAVNVSGIFVLNNTMHSESVSDLSEGPHTWSVSCQDLAGNTGVSDEFTFVIDTTPPVVQLEAPVDQTLFSTTRDVQLDYNVTDNLLPVTECRLYIDNSLNQTDSSITQAVTQSFFLTNLDLGTYAWNVECVDLVGNAANSTQWEFEVNISISAISPENNTIVDRDGTGPDPEIITLVANASDGASGVTVNFYADLSTPSIAGQTNLLLGSNTTNASGQAVLNFNPDSTRFAGNYSWRPSADRYVNDTPRTFLIYGTPSIDYQDALLDPNEEYNASQTIRINTTVTSTPESGAQLNALYGLIGNATLTDPASGLQYATLTGVDELTGTFTLSSTPVIGIWEAFVTTQAQFFYSANTSVREFVVKGPADALSPANGTRVDRDGFGPDPESITLVMQIPNAAAGNTVNFTADLISPSIAGQTNLLLGQNTTNATGHATLTFTPDATYFAGEYVWRAESDISFVNTTRTFVIMGGLTVERASPTTNPEDGYNQSDTAEFAFTIQSAPETQEQLATLYGIIANVTFEPNTTSAPVYTPSLSWTGSDWFGSQLIGLTDPVGLWRFSANASGVYHYPATSSVDFLTVFGLSNLTLQTGGGRVYELINFTANYSDTLNQPINSPSTVCEIRFDLGGYTAFEAMAYDAATGLYWFNRTFTETYTNADWNVVCDDPLYETQDVVSQFTVERTFADMLTPPGQIIDRDGVGPDPETLLLEAVIPQAPAGVTVNFYTNLTAPALGQTELFIGANTTDASGVAVFTWNPTTAVFAGNHTLYANATYADPRDVSNAQVFGSIESLFTSPLLNPNSNYTQNETITISANATTPGPETPVNLNADYALSFISFVQSMNGQDSFSLSFTNPFWSATYDLLDLAGVGVWNASVNASAQYHYPNSSQRSFDVFGFMNVTQATVSPTFHFVFGQATQVCRVQDQHTSVNVQGASVQFFRNSTLLGTNTTDADGLASFTFQTNASGNFSIRCVVDDQPGIFYFAGDAPQATDDLEVLPFPITPISPANGTRVDREGTDLVTPNNITLTVQVPSYVPDGTVITFNAALQEPLSQSPVVLGTAPVSSATASFVYTPDSTVFAGLHAWFGTNPDATSDGNRTYEVVATPELVFSEDELFPSVNYTQNETALFRVNLTSPGPETREQLANEYLTQISFTVQSPAGQDSNVTSFVDPYWQGQYNLLSLGGVGVWNVTANTSGIHQFPVSSVTRSFEVFGFANITSSTLTPAATHVYGSTTQTCRLQDQHTGVDVAGATIQFFRNATLVGTNTTDASGFAQLTFQTNSSGVFDVTCVFVDDPSIFYFAGDQPSATDVFTVTPFPITPISPVNGTQVGREATNATVPATIDLVVQVPSYVPDDIPVVFRANQTTPFGSSTLIIGAANTSGGQATLTYDPNSTSFAGLHEWFATADDGLPNGTRTYETIGSMAVTYTDDLLHPNVNYTQNETITLRYNLTSLGPESRAQLAADYNALVSFGVLNPSGGLAQDNASFIDPYWEGTFSLLDLGGVGVWTTSMAAQADHFFFSTGAPRTFDVFGFMNVSSTLTPSTIFAYQQATQECLITDLHTGVPVIGATVTFTQNATLLGTNTTDSSGSAAFTFQTNETGVYDITCAVQDELGLFYFAGPNNQSTDQLTVTPFPITPIAPANETEVDRDGGFPLIDDTIALQVSLPVEIPDGVPIEFVASTNTPVSQGPVVLGTNTSVGGIATLNYQPNTTTRVGLWEWTGANSEGIGIGTRTFISLGLLDVTFWDDAVFPDAVYTQNETVVVRTNITGPGPETRQELAGAHNAQANFTLTSANGQSTTSSAFIDPYWEGTFSLLDLGGVGVWNLTANATAEYFAITQSAQRQFTVFGFANVTSSTLVPAATHVYGSTTQTCRLQDQHTGVDVADATIQFFRNSTLVGSNTTNASGFAQLTFQTNSSGVFDVTCVFVDDPSIFYFAGDQPSATDVFTVTPFPITPISPVNGTLVDRDGVDALTPDVIELVVQVPSYVPDDILITFESALQAPVSASAVVIGTNTTQGGQARLFYNPATASFAGNHSWFATADDGLPNGTRVYTSLGGLVFDFTSPTLNPDQNYTQNESATYAFSLTSPGPETPDNLSALYAAQVNLTVRSPLGTQTDDALYTSPFWSLTRSLIPPGGVGVWNVSADAAASFFFSDASVLRAFDVFGLANITEASLSSSLVFAFEPVTVVCRVQDQDTAVDVSGAVVEFYRNATLLGSNTTDASGFAEFTFTTVISDVYTIRCVVDDQPGIFYLAGSEPEQNQTLTVVPYPVTPVSPANGTLVDRDGVNGSVANNITLTAQVPGFVPDGENLTFFANITDPITGFRENLGTALTVGGQAEFVYEPDASVRAGEWTWSADTTTNPGGANGTRTYHVMSGLDVTSWSLTSFPSVNHTQNETVEFRFNLTTLGPETRDELSALYNANLSFSVQSPNGVDANTTVYASPFWQGNYRLLTLGGVGVWNYSASAQANYSFAASSAQRQFTVFGLGNVTQLLALPNPVVVYNNITAQCRLQDQDSGAAVAGASIEFFFNDTSQGSAVTNSSGWASLEFPTSSTGLFDVTCVFDDQPSIFYFAGGQPNATVAVQVIEYGIDAISPQNNTIVDRDGAGADPESITLVAQADNIIPPGQTFMFYANITDPVLGSIPLFLGSNTTNATGAATLTWSPDSTVFAGNYTWFAEETFGLPNQTRTFLVYGGLQPVLNDPMQDPASEYNKTDTIRINATIITPGPETPEQLGTNYAAMVNATLTPPTRTATTLTLPYSPIIWSSTLTFSSDEELGVWNTSLRASARFFYANTSEQRTFTLTSLMNATQNTLTQEPIFVFGSTTSVCLVQDHFNASNVQGATVFFYRNETLLGVNTTNSSGLAQFTFQTNSRGVYDITCAVEDQPGIFYYAGPQNESTTTLTVLPFPITPTSPVNDSVVDRDEVNASVPNTLSLTVSVPSYVPDDTEITFLANLTSPFTQGPVTLGVANTTAGVATLIYNPPTSSWAGNHTWYATATDGSTNGSRRYLSIGSLNLDFTSPTLNPDVNYTQNESVTYTTNLTSPGPETRDDLAALYGAGVDLTIQSPLGMQQESASFFDPIWSVTRNIIPPGGVGVWNASANASATYFFSDSSALRTFDVFGLMNVTQSALDTSLVFAFEPARMVCRVQDQDTAVDVSGAVVEFYRNATLLGSNTTDASGFAEFTFTTAVSAVYDITCLVDDQPGIFYLAGSEPNATQTLTVVPYPVTPISPANATLVDRDGVNASVPNSISLLASVPGFVPDGENLTFFANITDPITGFRENLGTALTVGGQAEFVYEPDASVRAGEWTWSADTTTNPGGANGTRTYHVMSGLDVTSWSLDSFPSVNHTQNETVEFRFNLTSPGPETRDELSALYNANLDFTVNSSVSFDTNTTTFSTPFWTGVMNLLSLAGVGEYTYAATATADYAFPATSVTRSFDVFGFMNVTQTTLSAPTQFAFESVTQTCLVQDQHTSVAVAGAEVFFFRNETLLGSNFTNSSGFAQFTFQTDDSGVYTISCSVQDQPSIFYFAGDLPEQNTTLQVFPFPITPVSPANGTLVDRDGVDAFVQDTITLQVSVPGYVPDGVEVTFVANTTSPLTQGPIVLGSNLTQGGVVSFTYDPDSTTVAGVWNWSGQREGGGANGSRTFISIGSFSTDFADALDFPPAVIDQNDTITTRFNLTSASSETRAELAALYNAAVNFTLQSPTGADTNTTVFVNPFWEGFYNLLSLGGVGVWNITGDAQAQFFFPAATPQRSVTVLGYANMTENILAQNTIPVFSSAQVTCRLQDQHTTVPVAGAQVEFFLNGTSQGNATTNSSGFAQRSFVVESTGVFDVTCVFSDQLGIFYQAGAAPNATSQLAVMPYRLNAISPANNTIVDRDGVGPDPESITLIAQAQTSVPAGRTVTFQANITDPVLGSIPITLGTNTTNSSGAAVLTWTPDSFVYAGNYTWFATDVGAGIPNLTRSFLVFGGFTVDFANATHDPNDEYVQLDLVTINASLTSLGPESVSELNESYSSVLNATLTPPVQSNQSTLLSFINPFWSGQTPIPVTGDVGIWNASVRSSARFFYDAVVHDRNFSVIGLSNLTISDDSDFMVRRIFQNHSFFANYSDTLNQPINYGLTTCDIRFNTTGSWTAYEPMAFDTGLNQWRFSTNFTDAGNFTYNVFCDDPWYVSANVTDYFIVNRTAINSIAPPDGTIVDRDGFGPDPETVRLVLNVDDAIAGIEVNFTVTLIDPLSGVIQNLTIGSNTTIAGGNVSLDWTPNNTIYAGRYRFTGWAPQAEPNQTGFVDVYGGFTADYAFGFNPNATYNQTQTVEYVLNLSTPGPETISYLGLWHGYTANHSTIRPSGAVVETLLIEQGGLFVGNLTLGPVDEVGVYNTSLEVSLDYFYPAGGTLRNFTVFGLSNLNIFDQGDLGENVWALQDAEHFANWTGLLGDPMDVGACVIQYPFSTLRNMTFNASSGFWENTTVYGFAGIALYNVTCEREFYWPATALANATVLSEVNLTADYSFVSLADDEWRVVMNVTNHQVYTEYNVTLASVFGPRITPAFITAPTSQFAVTGQHPGVFAHWYFDDLAPGETRTVEIDVEGVDDWYFEPVIGVSSPAYSSVVFS